MIPILEPAQIPGILVYALFLTVMPGIPTVILAPAIFYVLGYIPSRRSRLLLPAAGAVLMLAVTVIYSSGYQSEVECRKTWAMMMTTSFLLNAQVILAPFPFLRRSVSTYSPVCRAGVHPARTFYLLACFRFIGGE